MRLSAPKPPPVPDPNQVAATQAAYNKQALQQSQAASLTGQETPIGSLEYFQSGTDAQGNPMWTAKSELSPEQQALLNYLQGSQNIAGQTGEQLMGNAAGQYSSPADLFGSADALTEQRLAQNQEFLRPQYEDQRSWLDSQLRNQGILPDSKDGEGHSAYQSQMRGLLNQQDLATQQYLSTIQPQSMQEALTQFMLPLQTASTLMGLGAPADLKSSFVQTPTFTAQPANFIGAQGQANEMAQSNYKAKMDQYSAMLNGVFGIGKAIVGMPGGMPGSTGGMPGTGTP